MLFVLLWSTSIICNITLTLYKYVFIIFNFLHNKCHTEFISTPFPHGYPNTNSQAQLQKVLHALISLSQSVTSKKYAFANRSP